MSAESGDLRPGGVIWERVLQTGGLGPVLC